MPRKGGVEAIAEIKAEQPETRILVLTSFAEDRLAFEAIKAGAIGYLLKDHPRATSSRRFATCIGASCRCTRRSL